MHHKPAGSVVHFAALVEKLSVLAIKDGECRLDFTGDFGHEIGLFKIKLDDNGLIKKLDADLECSFSVLGIFRIGQRIKSRS